MKKSRGGERKSTARRTRARPAPRLGRPPGTSSAETRERILTAARDCFVRVGYERATNRDVAAGAGLTAAAIYKHFKSKTALYCAVALQCIDELMPALRDAIAAQSSARAALREILRVSASTEQRHGSAARFLASVALDMQRHPEVARGMMTQPGTLYEVLIELVGKAVSTGELEANKAERTLAVLVASMMGLSMHQAALGGKYSESAAQGLIDLFDGTLFR